MIMSSAKTTSQLHCGTTLIQYIEVWTATADGSQLELKSACTVQSGNQPSSGSAQLGQVAARGEGIAGRAWNQKSATILQEKPCELLDGISQQCGVVLSAVLAISVFDQTDIRGVVVLGLGDGYGAAEVWRRDDRDELSVDVACYSGLPSFEFMNRYVRFPKGAGLPGQIWQSGEPQIVQDLATNEAFVRTFDNDPAQLTAAIGIPIGSIHGFPNAVLLLLSSEQTPLVGSIEFWGCEQLPLHENEETPGVKLTRCSVVGVDAAIDPAGWQNQIAKSVAAHRMPALITSAQETLPEGASFVLCIPVFKSKQLVGIISLLS